jgi:peptide/nickel transport system permease protein
MNKVLANGIFLFSLFLAVAIIGPEIAPFDTDYSEKFWYEGETTIISPAKPSLRHPLGTDTWGYDMLSLLLYGAKYTLLAVVSVSAMRIATAILINLLNFCFGGNSINWGLPKGLTAIPGFVLIYFLFFAINYNPPVSPGTIAFLQLFCIMLFGLPRFASSFSLKIAETEKEPFVEAARSVGAGRVRLFFHHILPQHRETIALNFVGESIATLNLIGQLGIFDMYIGGTKTTPAPLLFHSQTHEWAGLVGSYRGKLFSSDWWLLGFPLGAYLFLLLSLYLISRGLELRTRHRI